MEFISLAFACLIGSFCLLIGLRIYDYRADQAEWRRLAALQSANPERFDPAMLTGLPEAAQRFFKFAIAPGTPLLTVAEIDMSGYFSLGSRETPNYRRMRAREILAAPHGFVWQMRMSGWMSVSGSDSVCWTRFRLCNLIPVARFGEDPNQTRSAFGRCVAESVFWTPAVLLMAPDVAWQEVGTDTARATMIQGALSQSVDITVNAEGQPLSVRFMRWTNANSEKQYRLQPFGGVLSDFRQVHGYRLPFRVDGGNMFGSEEYFPFFKAEVTDIRFPGLT